MRVHQWKDRPMKDHLLKFHPLKDHPSRGHPWKFHPLKDQIYKVHQWIGHPSKESLKDLRSKEKIRCRLEKEEELEAPKELNSMVSAQCLLEDNLDQSVLDTTDMKLLINSIIRKIIIQEISRILEALLPLKEAQGTRDLERTNQILKKENSHLLLMDMKCQKKWRIHSILSSLILHSTNNNPCRWPIKIRRNVTGSQEMEIPSKELMTLPSIIS